MLSKKFNLGLGLYELASWGGETVMPLFLKAGSLSCIQLGTDHMAHLVGSKGGPASTEHVQSV